MLIYLIPEDVDWYNLRSLKPFLSRVILTREELEEDLGLDEIKHELFCSLKANSLKTGTNIKMTVFAFWFDSNKELNYQFLGTQVIRGSRF